MKTVIDIRQSPKNRQWYWHVKRANGQIFVASEGYTRRTSAARAAERFLAAMRGTVEIRAPRASR